MLSAGCEERERSRGDGGPPGGGGDASASCITEPPSTPPCSAETRTCLEAAAEGTGTVSACFDAEPNVDACYVCIDDALLGCLGDNGCDAQAYACCVSSECPDLEGARACRTAAETGTCSDGLSTLVDCGVTPIEDGTCTLLHPSCFAG